MKNQKTDWTGIQPVLESVGKDGCYVLSLFSIAEEYNKKPLDFISALRTILSKKFIRPDMYVERPCEILQELTDVKWQLKSWNYKQEGQYVIEKWYNDRTKYNHFRRPGTDTLPNSITVKEGRIVNTYVFTVVGEVLCKNCKYYENLRCKRLGSAVVAEGYCNKGVRK